MYGYHLTCGSHVIRLCLLVCACIFVCVGVYVPCNLRICAIWTQRKANHHMALHLLPSFQLRKWTTVHVYEQWTSPYKQARPRCYTKPSTVQNIFQPIPGLINCTGVTGRWGLLPHVQNAVRRLALSPGGWQWQRFCTQVDYIATKYDSDNWLVR